MIVMSVSPARTASSTTHWIAGLSRSGSISLGWDLVAGRNRVPSPAAGTTSFLTVAMVPALPRGLRIIPSRGNPLLSSSMPALVRFAPYTRIHFVHAHVRVRVHVLRPAHRGLPAHLRGP